MEKEKQIDECLELIKKMYSINQEREELIEQRAEKEAEFKAYLREQDKAIEAAKDRFNVIGRTVIDTDIKNTGHLRDEVKKCLELLGVEFKGDMPITGNIHNEPYKGFISGDNKEVGTKVVYGDSIDAVLDKAARISDKISAYTNVNIGVLNKTEGQYIDFRKFDIAKRYDISNVYLTLPHVDKEEYSQMIKSLKAEGARFNSYIKKWYIPHELSQKEFFQPYIAELPRQRDYSRQRHYTSQELSLVCGSTGKTVNDMLSRNDGYVRITYEDNGRGRIAPKAEFCEHKTPDETEHAGKWLSDSNVRTVLVEGREMSKDILYAGKGYRINPEDEILKKTPYAAITGEEDAGGKYYTIYGVHDISGMVCRLSPRRFDTSEQAESNVPEGHKLISPEELKSESKLYEDVWSKLIKDDIENSGYGYSCYMVKNIKLLNYETNKSWSLKDISAVYKQIDGEKLPDGISELAGTYIKRIGDECVNLQRMEFQAETF